MGAVCEEFGVSEEQLVSRDRHQNIAIARAVLMFLLALQTRDSYTEIGRYLGNRHRSTVRNGVVAMEDEINVSPPVARQVTAIVKRLEPA